MKNQFRAGVYLLETLTAGMYNDPLSVYREYIQNSVDSIDSCQNKSNKKVKVSIHPVENRITIRDNAIGLKAKEAYHTLSGVGTSDKNVKGRLRGFRGIGRLGGVAFSNRVVFTTKARGENVVTAQEWDCAKLRYYLEDKANSHMTLEQLFGLVTKFNQSETNEVNKEFFEVKLEGTASFRNHINDLKRVRDYISKVAPVDYNPLAFSFGSRINRYLKANVPNYGHYNIFLNSKRVYKPYKDFVRVTKGANDQIADIEFVNIKIDGKTAAFGWLGKRRNLIGSIVKGDDSSGIVVRVGNILLGDSHLLDRCFREPRFNSYVVGELHIAHPYLRPNSRRDDFVDNHSKTSFYNAVQKQIGLPISKEIRLKSRNRSKSIATLTDAAMPYSSQTSETLARSSSRKIESRFSNDIAHMLLEQILDNCKDCKYLNEILDPIFRR